MPDPNCVFPRISLVVPSYNQAGYLRDTFESIFRQGYPNLEVVVMDGGSTDGSVDIIRAYAPRLKHWQSERDGGQSAAINAGMKHCAGDLVGWLNSDDFFWGDCLWTLARAYRTHPGHGLYVGNGLRYVQEERRYYPFCTRHVAFSREALLRGVDSVLQPATFFLREAWESVGGVENTLRFCMDWDIYLRISRTYPVVVINDFLAVSREYEDTKTRSGKMDRAAEIVRMIRRHTGAEVTPGTLVYLFETLRDVTEGITYPEMGQPVRRGLEVAAYQVASTFGGLGHLFPYESDSQDRIYTHLPTDGELIRPCEPTLRWPSVSVICRVEQDPAAANTAAESLLRHGYSGLELVFAGPAGTVSELTARYPGSRAVVCDGNAHAAVCINRALEAATGDVVGWLEPDELLTQGALAEVGRAFAADVALDAVFGNALYTDGDGLPCPIPAGRFRSALALGVAAGLPGLEQYWLLPTLTPPPALFFRRRALRHDGVLDDTRTHTYAHEFLARLLRWGKVNKLERTQVLRRRPFPAAAVEAELYARSRPRWRKDGAREFVKTWRSFVGGYLRRRLGPGRRGLRFWTAASLVGVSALTGVGNPERLFSRSAPIARSPRRLPERESDAAILSGPQPKVRVTACLTHWPDPGPERQLLEQLRTFARLDCFVLQSRGDETADSVHTPESVRQTRPKLVRPTPLRGRLFDWLRHRGLPLPGSRSPLAILDQLRTLQTGLFALLQLTLQKQPPDCLLVGFENNPVATMLQVEHPRTRLVLLAGRLSVPASDSLELRRGEEFMRRNLSLYDGILVTSIADRDELLAQHGVLPERTALFAADGEVEFVDGNGQSHRGLEAWLSLLHALPRRGSARVPDVPVFQPAAA